jgi:hypothetical protein
MFQRILESKVGKLKELLDEQDWGYLYRISDYCTSREQELEEKQEGKKHTLELSYDIKSMFLDSIGPNEPYGDAPTNRDKITRNNLRDELREKVKKL